MTESARSETVCNCHGIMYLDCPNYRAAKGRSVVAMTPSDQAREALQRRSHMAAGAVIPEFGERMTNAKSIADAMEPAMGLFERLDLMTELFHAMRFHAGDYEKCEEAPCLANRAALSKFLEVTK